MNAQPIGDRRPSPRDEERRYLLARAEAETAAAQQATHPGAVQAHYQLAELYLDLVYGTADDDRS